MTVTVLGSKMMFNKKKQEAIDLDQRQRRGSKYEDHNVQHDVRLGAPPRPSGLPKSLGDILSSSDLRYKFRVFLKERLSGESLMFYEAIELYEKIEDLKWRKRAAEGLVSKFVVSDADLEVNISASCKTKILRTTKWEKESFNEAKSEIYELLKSNFFAPFIAREFLMDE